MTTDQEVWGSTPYVSTRLSRTYRNVSPFFMEFAQHKPRHLRLALVSFCYGLFKEKAPSEALFRWYVKAFSVSSLACA